MNDKHQIILEKHFSETVVVCAMCYRDNVVLNDIEFEDFKVFGTTNFEFGTLCNHTKVIAVSGGAVNALEAFCKKS